MTDRIPDDRVLDHIGQKENLRDADGYWWCSTGGRVAM
jgi:hypothetical protein